MKAVRLYPWRVPDLKLLGKVDLVLYARVIIGVLSLLGIGFLLWFYTHQNGLVAASFNEIKSQVDGGDQLTPADLGDLAHQVCVLDARISAEESFFQPIAATLSGGGWCGNYARVFIRFAGEAGYPAHKFHIQSGGRSHTLAEVYYQGKWRIIDPFFNQVYLLPGGEMATYQDIKENPELLKTPSQRPLNDPKLDKIYRGYTRIFPALYRDADDFQPALDRSAFYHNAFIVLSYPFSVFYEGGRRPFLPNWLDRPELLGVYILSLISIVSLGPVGFRYVRNRRKDR